MFEQLESQRMLAVNAYVSGWTLIVEGDNQANWVSISRSNGLIWVNVWQGEAAYDNFHINEDNVYEIQFMGGGGNDLLTVANNITVPTTIWGGAGNDYLLGGGGVTDLAGQGFGWNGSGNDYLLGGADADWIYGDAGSDVLVGGSGSDYLYAKDGTPGNDIIYGNNMDGSGGGGAFDIAVIDMVYPYMDGVTGVEAVSV